MKKNKIMSLMCAILLAFTFFLSGCSVARIRKLFGTYVLCLEETKLSNSLYDSANAANNITCAFLTIDKNTVSIEIRSKDAVYLPKNIRYDFPVEKIKENSIIIEYNGEHIGIGFLNKNAFVTFPVLASSSGSGNYTNMIDLQLCFIKADAPVSIGIYYLNEVTDSSFNDITQEVKSITDYKIELFSDGRFGFSIAAGTTPGNWVTSYGRFDRKEDYLFFDFNNIAGMQKFFTDDGVYYWDNGFTNGFTLRGANNYRYTFVTIDSGLEDDIGEFLKEGIYSSYAGIYGLDKVIITVADIDQDITATQKLIADYRFKMNADGTFGYYIASPSMPGIWSIVCEGHYIISGNTLTFDFSQGGLEELFDPVASISGSSIIVKQIELSKYHFTKIS